MKSNELIGQVAAVYLQADLDEEEHSQGVSRYLLDCLSAEQTAAVATAVLNDTSLCERVDVKLPEKFMAGHGLPADVLTNERTTYFRNADCLKGALLVASTGDDERFSLKELAPIGSAQLLANPDIWIRCLNPEIGLNDERRKWWKQCLLGLMQVRAFGLERFADYVLATSEQMKKEGEPLLEALGLALPALRVPRDKTHYTAISSKNGGHVSKWKALHNKVINRRACYLLKQTPTHSLLSTDVLTQSYEQVKDSIEPANYSIIEDFINSPSGWNDAAAKLSDCEWSAVSCLFDGLKRESFNIGVKTTEFFDERYPEVLSSNEREYLTLLTRRKPKEADEDDEAFFENHRQLLREDPSLKTKWDKFIFGAPVECDDFLVGIVECLEAFYDQSQQNTNSSILRIRSDKRTKHHLRGLNHEAGLFFSMRYGALPHLFPKEVEWDVGELFRYEDRLNEWRKKKNAKINRSRARAALRIKFFLEFQGTVGNKLLPTVTKQLVWKFNPDGVPCELIGDCERLSKNPFLRASASREPVSGKGVLQPLDIRDSASLHACYAQDRGSLIPAYSKDKDLSREWTQNIESASDERFLKPEIALKLRQLWNLFAKSYTTCIEEFRNGGYSSELREQAEQFGLLLEEVKKVALGDRVRELLLKPLLKIGVAEIEGDSAACIIPPWHPLRFLSLFNKIFQVTDLLKKLLSGENVSFSDARLYFRDIGTSIAKVYYPEIVIDWRKGSPEILACTDHYLDYSVHESPVVQNDGCDDTNENPAPAAQLVIDLVKRYLVLYPHERTNLSTVLYNCDSARLPQAVVERMGDLNVGNGELRCEVILRHRDPTRLAELYERIVEATDAKEESFGGSESSADFMARLRIGIMADQAPAPLENEGRPTDIVFLDDVIARHAKLDWYAVPKTVVPGELLHPPAISRRRPSAEDDMSSVAYLICPKQTEESWKYLEAISSFFCASRESSTGKCYIPARSLDFSNKQTMTIFDEAHRLGNWVVNYDELLDRRQLRNQKVRVIRFKQITNVGKNILVSSHAPLGLLKSMVRRRIESLQPVFSDTDLKIVTERFVSDANKISGDLALRAAKRGRSASELMGVVLSKYLVEKEIGNTLACGWFFLDDYAEWLGQREGRIADLMALHLERVDNRFRIGIIVTEAKYVVFKSLSAKRKESQKQLRETVLRINDALFGQPVRYDRNLWTTRLANLITNGIHLPSTFSPAVHEWANALQREECDIYVRGYSHVFVSGPSDCPDCSERVAIPDLDECYQEVFSRSDVKLLTEAYANQQDPLCVRTEATDSKDLPTRNYSRIDPVTPHTPDKLPPNGHSDKGASTNVTSEHGNEPGTQQNQTKSEPHRLKDSRMEALLDKCSGAIQVDHTMQEHADTWVKNTASECKSALHQFSLKAKLLEQKLTPNCALLKFEGSSNMTVDQVMKHRGEFLTTHGLNIVSVRPEPGRVCISIPRPNRQVLGLLELWSRWDIKKARKSGEVLIGANEDDNSLVRLHPRRHAPHTLIAGATGSGKSVLLQNMILSIAAANRSLDAQLILIDPKRVSFNKFVDLPHVRGDIIKQQTDAVVTLNSLVEEMDARYALFEKHGVEDIYELKKMGHGGEVPLLWVIHDEFALWMIDDEYANTVDAVVKKLAVAARAAGIFLVFAAQRPDKDVFSMQLRANLGNRLVLRVDAAGTSDLSLGEKGLGAERLLGNGHMIARLEGNPVEIYVQVPFLDGSMAKEVVAAIAEQPN